MKRVLAVFFIIPSLALGAFTEFYCQSGGSDLNGGSDTNNSAGYTSINGNWSTVTNVFTPTDNSTPSSSVTAGQFASVYLNAATVGVYIGRVTNVASGVNGGITVSSTANIGTAPSTGNGTVTIKVGGALKGPHAGTNWPLSSSIGAATDASGDMVRLNLKNDATYSISSSMTFHPDKSVIQGYSSSPGDGGKATIDTSTNVVGVTISGLSNNGMMADVEIKGSQTSGTTTLLTLSSGMTLVRVIVHGSRANGISSSAGLTLIEGEVYGNNTSNTSNDAAISTTGTCCLINSYVHDNTGSNTAGIDVGAAINLYVFNSIFDTNGAQGIRIRSGPGAAQIVNDDFYNNGGDAFANSAASESMMNIRNCNFVKNTGKAINITSSVSCSGFIDNNGYGSGTQANGGANVIEAMIDSGTGVTYASGVTPWKAPTTGDFRLSLSSAYFAGRGAFTETGNSKTGSVGYPDIGAVEAHQTTSRTWGK